MDDVNRILRGGKTPAVMPRVSSGAGPVFGPGNGRGIGGAQAGTGGRGPGGRGHASAAGAAKGGERDDDSTPMAYDPLTGEPLELDGDGNANAAAAAAVAASVSPKCEDKVDYDIMVDLVDLIMKTEGNGGNGGGGGGGARAGGSHGRSRGGGGGGGRGRDDRQGQRRGGSGGGGSESGTSGSWRQGRGGRGKGEATRAGDGSDEPLGAILIFLPGFAEIDQLVKALERHPRIGRGSRIFPLHSSLPAHQQRSIFQRMPPGVRKIVVSTNIAETSVSVPVECCCRRGRCLFYFILFLFPCGGGTSLKIVARVSLAVDLASFSVSCRVLLSIFLRPSRNLKSISSMHRCCAFFDLRL